MITLKLKKGAERRLKTGSLWIYSNEVDNQASPLKSFAPGDQAVVETAQGKSLGIATVNPGVLICARLVSTDVKIPLDKSLLVHRLNIALSLRKRIFSAPYYRLVYGESDYLPGLVVDRFGDYFSVQINTAGMEQVREAIIEALEQVFKPRGIVLRNDGASRSQEGLEQAIDVVSGEIPEFIELEENNTRFVTSLVQGQKTGWFYDHRENRRQMQNWVKDKRVLDVFCYAGAWGVQALTAGAKAVTCVDSSEWAVELAHENATLNNHDQQLESYQGNALEVLKALLAEQEKFDVVILDPPAFIKKQKDHKKGLEAYHHYNQLALRLLNRDGLLISASCSMHLKRQELMDVVRVAGRHIDRQLQVVYQGGQGVDHPVHPAMVETDYLKAVFARSL